MKIIIDQTTKENRSRGNPASITQVRLTMNKSMPKSSWFTVFIQIQQSYKQF